MKTARLAALRPPYDTLTSPKGGPWPVADGVFPLAAPAGITPEIDALMRGMLMVRPGLLCLVDAASGGVVQLRGALPHPDPRCERNTPPLAQVGQPYSTLLECIVPEHGEDRRLVLEALTGVLTGVRASVEVGPLRWGADGYLEIIAQRLPAPGDYLLVAHFDVTQRQRAEREVRRIREQVVHWDWVMALGELAASLAHELSQPLTAIQGNAQAALNFLERGEDLDEVRDSLQDIVSNNAHASDIIRSMRMRGMRALLKRGQPRMASLNINAAAQDAARMASAEARRRKIAITLDLTEHLPDVRGDAIQIQQVLSNLLLNAFDAVAERNDSQRWVRMATRMAADDAVEVTVEDSGPGIAAADRERIFDPFFSTREGRLGMGLYIARSIITAHHGSIRMETGAGGGTLLRCTLPRPRAGSGRPKNRTKPRTMVLIVDQDQTVLTGLGRLLRSAGFGVETFSSPLDLLQREPTDDAGCIVMDLHMPDFDGLRMLEVLKQQGCSMPVLFLTEAADVASCVKAMKGGAANFLIKPPDEKELIALIKQAVAEHEVIRERLHWKHEWQRRFGRLSPREYQVCRLVALGLLNKQIAGQLGLAEKTVKIHRGQAMRKLGLRSVAELVRVMDRLNPSDDTQQIAGQVSERTSLVEDNIFAAERDKFSP